MSRGPGRLERAIRALFDASPDQAFTTDELAEHCYPDAQAIGKKHQVAVLRAARNMLKDDPDWTMYSDAHQGGRMIFFNRDNATSHTFAAGISGERTYRSEKRANRKRYDWVQRDGCRYRLPFNTVLNRWLASVDRPLLPTDAPQAKQRADVLASMDGEYGRKTRDWFEGDIVWHRVMRDADAATRDKLLDAEHEIWLCGPEVWSGWTQARALWAAKPDVWLKRFQAAGPNGKETHIQEVAAVALQVDAAALAAKARKLIVENDPDAIRAGLHEIADALERPGDLRISNASTSANPLSNGLAV
jgi:hypothetical protein